MPNGDANVDYEELEKFFAPIAEAVHRVAANRNLLVDKYYHDAPQWSLRFRHPNRGDASIELMRKEPDRLVVSAVWYFDDYDKFTRYLHWFEKCECPRDPDAVSQILDDQLKRVCATEFGNWNQVGNDYERIWSRYSKEQFESLHRQLPEPTLDD